MKNGIDRQYIDLLKDILENGTEKLDRTGTGTISVFGRQIRHKMSEGFPLLTTKKMYFKGIVTELIWFLMGNTNIKYLVDNDCHIWDGDCYQAYIKRYNKGEYVGKTKLLKNSKKNRTLTEPFTKEEFANKIKTDDKFAKKFGNLGPIYGAQWRGWNTGEYITTGYNGSHTVLGEKVIDQIQNAINLLKTDPDSRRNRVSAWNVGKLDQMTLPPCHTDFQFYTRELSDNERAKLYWDKRGIDKPILPALRKDIDNDNTPTRAISLMYNARSQDVPLGTPYNIASYSLLLEIIGKIVNMVPDELIANMGDCHIYKNQIEGVKEQINREPFELPTLKHMKSDAFYKVLGDDVSLFSHLDNTDFLVENYQSHPKIYFPLSN